MIFTIDGNLLEGFDFDKLVEYYKIRL